MLGLILVSRQRLQLLIIAVEDTMNQDEAL